MKFASVALTVPSRASSPFLHLGLDDDHVEREEVVQRISGGEQQYVGGSYIPRQPQLTSLRDLPGEVGVHKDQIVREPKFVIVPCVVIRMGRFSRDFSRMISMRILEIARVIWGIEGYIYFLGQ